MAGRVDADARRKQVAAVATRIIARHGIDAATVRAIAAEAGCSTKIVSRYFADKRELLLVVYRGGAQRSRERLMQARLTHGDDVQACTEALLPLDEETRADWAVVLAFWSLAIADEALRREQRRRVHSARRYLEAVIDNAVLEGKLRDDIDVEDLASELMTVVSGIAVQQQFDASAWSSARQRALVAGVLARVAAAPDRSAAADAPPVSTAPSRRRR